VVGDRRRRDGPRPKTYAGWVRASLTAAGITGSLPWGLAQDVCEILLATNRTVHPCAWVDRFVREAAEAKSAALPHHNV
jgi:hypothetical protein